jgi:phosphoribosylamine-glycine ligase
MGAYSPAPIVTPQMHARIMREIILPTVAGMAKDGITYTGFLYAGVMIDEAGDPKTLNSTAVSAIPETQPIMMRLKSDLVDLVEHGINGTLDQVDTEWDRRVALVWCLPRMATGQSTQGRCDPRPWSAARMRMCSMRVPRWRAIRIRPAVACFASRHWVTP